MLCRLAVSVFACGLALYGTGQDAINISGGILARHMPFGTVLDPFVDSQGGITGYTRCGDSAIWTGNYLAAESFRYAVTKSPEALRNVRIALAGIQGLIDVTGNGGLARCYIPKDTPYAAGLVREELQENRVHEGPCLGRDCFWVGDTSRDQYTGVFFGLAVAWEMVGDAEVRSQVKDQITRLLNRLIEDDWAVKRPDGSISTVFWFRPDQKLNLLNIGSKVNSRFSSRYTWARLLEAGLTSAPILTEVADPYNSYFKFNLDVLTFYTLVRFEGNRTYRSYYEAAYTILRRTIDDHGNAHFNMIDRALRGPNERRDAETRALLEQWLTRSRRDFGVDLRGLVRTCGGRACEPVPVPWRVPTDFLWQRSPFQLVGGGSGTIESPGIDYILPYWMARYYGVL